MNENTPTWSRITAQLVRGEELGGPAASWAMDEVMSGNATPVQLAGFLVALQSKGVTSTELEALADSMIEHARAVDVLEALGIRLDLPVSQVEELVSRIGMTFLFAQVFHPSMKYAAEARRGLGIPTVMNILGPITNPARPRASAVGVADPTIAPTVAGVFASRGTSALVFRGQDGLDELTVTAPSDIWEVRGGEVRRHVLDPAVLVDVPRSGHDSLRGGTAEENAQVARDLYAGLRHGRMGPIRDAVLLNAAAGVVAFDGIGQPAEDGFEERFVAAFDEVVNTLDSGRPAELINRWAAASQDAFERQG